MPMLCTEHPCKHWFLFCQKRFRNWNWKNYFWLKLKERDWYKWALVNINQGWYPRIYYFRCPWQFYWKFEFSNPLWHLNDTFTSISFLQFRINMHYFSIKIGWSPFSNKIGFTFLSVARNGHKHFATNFISYAHMQSHAICNHSFFGNLAIQLLHLPTHTM